MFDPAPTSPLVLKLPPAFDGATSIPVELTFPTGTAHFYEQKTWVGSTTLGDTTQATFEALRFNATPFQMGVRINQTGDITTIPILGPVQHYVFYDTMTIVNTTVDGHVLAPGNVWRQVVQEGNDIFIVTKGYGVGILPELNQRLGPTLWKGVDKHINEALHPAELPDPGGTFPVDFYRELNINPGGQQVLTVGEILADSKVVIISGVATVADSVASFSGSNQIVTTSTAAGAGIHIAANKIAGIFQNSDGDPTLALTPAANNDARALSFEPTGGVTYSLAGNTFEAPAGSQVAVNDASTVVFSNDAGRRPATHDCLSHEWHAHRHSICA